MGGLGGDEVREGGREVGDCEVRESQVTMR